MPLVTQNPLIGLLAEDYCQMVAIIEHEGGKHPKPIDTFRFNANGSTDFVLEVLLDCLHTH